MNLFKIGNKFLCFNNSDAGVHWVDVALEDLCSKNNNGSTFRQLNNPISRTFKLFYDEV